MADTNIVTLNTSSYNQIKSENFKLELFVENLLLEARLSDDPYLKGQYNRNGLRDDKIEDKKEE